MHKAERVDTHRKKPLAELNHIESSTPSLRLADRSLNAAEVLRQVTLTKLPLFAIPPQQVEKNLVVPAIK